MGGVTPSVDRTAGLGTVLSWSGKAGANDQAVDERCGMRHPCLERFAHCAGACEEVENGTSLEDGISLLHWTGDIDRRSAFGGRDATYESVDGRVASQEPSPAWW